MEQQNSTIIETPETFDIITVEDQWKNPKAQLREGELVRVIVQAHGRFDNETYAVLHTTGSQHSPYATHYWSEEMGYFMGGYLPAGTTATQAMKEFIEWLSTRTIYLSTS